MFPAIAAAATTAPGRGEQGDERKKKKQRVDERKKKGGAALEEDDVSKGRKREELSEEEEEDDDGQQQQGKGGAKKVKKNSFDVLGLSAPVMAGIRKLGYHRPTPIQKQSLPLSLSGRDVVAMARTGSGKTAAFLIPVVEKLKGAHSSTVGARAVILSPTRELSQQTYKFTLQLAFATSLRVCLLQGGDSLEAQFEALSNNPDVLIATPGRLMHLLAEVPDFKLSKVQILVIDEADRMFEAGFAGQINEILRSLPPERQTLLFSATMPRQVIEFTRAGLQNPELVRLDTESRVSENLRLAFFSVRSEDSKLAALNHLLSEVLELSQEIDQKQKAQDAQQVVIFVATKHHVDLVAGVVSSCLPNIGAVSVIYGSMDMESRKLSLDRFRSKESKILIVTDIAARGIDIPLLDYVINFSFPPSAKLFVHRVGRVARQGRDGIAFSIVAPDELPFMFDIFLYLGRSAEFAPVAKPHMKLADLMPDDVWVGTFPQNVIDSETERVRNAITLDVELWGVERSSYNAYSLYCRTRPDASKRSVARAKEMLAEKTNTTTHPLLRAFESKLEVTGKITPAAAIAELAGFRPPKTIFEEHVGAVTGKGKYSQLATPTTIAKATALMMHKKRSMHQKAIVSKKSSVQNTADNDETPFDDEHHLNGEGQGQLRSLNNISQPALERKRYISKAERKRMKKDGASALSVPETPKKEKDSAAKRDFRDENFYVSYEPTSYNRDAENLLSLDHMRKDEGKGEQRYSRLEDAVLDMTPDEQHDMIQKKRLFRWDSRKRNYVRASLKDHASAGRIKNESGALVNMKDIKNRGKIYEKWQSRTRKRIGTNNGTGTVQFDDGGGDESEPRSTPRSSTDVKKIAAAKRAHVWEQQAKKRTRGDSTNIEAGDGIKTTKEIQNKKKLQKKKSGQKKIKKGGKKFRK